MYPARRLRNINAFCGVKVISTFHKYKFGINMRLYKILILLLLLCSFSVSAQAGEGDNGNGFGGLVTEKDGCRVNWGNGIISATSEVQPMADTIDPVRTRALAVRMGGGASRKLLLDSILALPLDGKKNISGVLKDDLKSLNSLRGVVQNSLLSTSLTADGTVLVTASLNLRETLSPIIIPVTIPFLSGIAPTISGKRSEGNVLQEMAESSDVSERKAAVHSGVVIDARGYRVTPVLLPIVYDGKGVGVYGVFAAARESVIKNGMAAYVVDGSAEILRSRVGSFPLVVKPVNTQGSKRSNLILSLEDSARVRAVLKRNSVIQNCAVAILVDARSSQDDGQIISDNEVLDDIAEQADSLENGSEEILQEDSLEENTVSSDRE